MKKKKENIPSESMEDDKLAREIIRNEKEVRVPLVSKPLEKKEPTRTERQIEEIVNEISEYDPAQVFDPDHLGYDKATIFMAKIIPMQDCSYLVGCKINLMETTFKLLTLCDNPAIEL